jgi:hypothetical protein
LKSPWSFLKHIYLVDGKDNLRKTPKCSDDIICKFIDYLLSVFWGSLR